MLNIAAIMDRVQAGVTAAVEATAKAIADDAKSRAPVRKIFAGDRGRATLQSVEEVAAETALRSRLGLSPGPVRTQRTPAARVHGFGPRRLLASPILPAFDPRAHRFRGAQGAFTSRANFRQTQPGQLRFDTPLTARGRYEVKTGRANITLGAGKSYVGGRLRSEIYATPAAGSVRITAKVVSPTPYAKYVEFGTRHNRAQPYLRPAVAAQRDAFRARVAGALR